jgi:hypothetical protein
MESEAFRKCAVGNCLSLTLKGSDTCANHYLPPSTPTNRWPYVPPDVAKALNSDPVRSPSHYMVPGSDLEIGDFIAHLPFYVGSAIKYAYRAGKKDPAKERQDLEKAIKSLQLHLKHLERIRG